MNENEFPRAEVKTVSTGDIPTPITSCEELGIDIETQPFVPSRGRNLNELQKRAAAFSQPSGDALPTLIPAGITSRIQHLNIALNVDPFTFNLKQALHTDDLRNINWILRDPGVVEAFRSNVTTCLDEINGTLKSVKEKWAAALPPKSPASGVNFPIIYFISKTFSYPDTNFANEFSKGLPLVGEIKPCEVLVPKLRDASLTIQQWRAGLPARNRKIIGQLKKNSDSELSRHCWMKTLNEVQKGWVSTPEPISAKTIETIPLSPRFAIWEQHGAQKRKIRLIDDFKRSQVNALLHLKDTSIPNTLDTMFAMARAFALSWPLVTLMLTIMDFAHAYKHIGLDPNSTQFAVIALANPEGEVMMAHLNTQPFGSRRAPANWARVTQFVAFVLRKLYRIWIGVYVDDVFCLEPDSTIVSAQLAIKDLCRILGLQLAPDKEIAPTISAMLLGAEVRLSRGFIHATLPPQKVSAILDEILDILKRNTLTPAHASKLRGKLGFAQSLLFGRFGRAMLKPLAERQYSTTRKRAPLTTNLRAALEWWSAALKRPTPRLVPLRPIRPCVVYSDACGEGHLGAVLCSPKEVVTHCHAPLWMHEAGGGIYEWEILAALLALCLVCKYTKHTPIVLFVDNKSAASALISGTGTSDLATQICAAFWALAASAGVNVWIEWVPSHLNIADAPSRACNRLRNDNEITNSFEVIPPLHKFLKRVTAPFHLSQARYGHRGLKTVAKIPFCFNFCHKETPPPSGDETFSAL